MPAELPATLHETLGDLVHDVRTEADGDSDLALDLILASLSRAAGGPAVLATALFRLLDREEEGTPRAACDASYGTYVAEAMMKRVARGVVADPNGVTRRFAYLLDAAREERHGSLDSVWGPRLCWARDDRLDTDEPTRTYSPVTESSGEDLRRDRSRERAREILGAASPAEEDLLDCECGAGPFSDPDAVEAHRRQWHGATSVATEVRP